MRQVGGSARSIKRIPFVKEDAHHARVKDRNVTRTERHHTKGILFVVWGEESKFFLICETDTNLMVTGFGLFKADKYKRPTESLKLSMALSKRGMGYSKGRVTWFNRRSETHDTHAPNEIENIGDGCIPDEVWQRGRWRIPMTHIISGSIHCREGLERAP